MEEYIVPLGVSAAVPFDGRHLSSVAFRMPKELILFDCGEATQFRIRDGGIRPGPLSTICVTHLHGDHYYGLMGMLATLSLLGRSDPLTIVGPVGLARFIDSDPGLEGRSRLFEINFIEIDSDFSSGVVLNGSGYTIRAARLDHTIFAIGYRIDIDDSPGTLDVELARSLGVVDPVQYGHLKKGRSVVGMLGRVEAADVLGTPHRGASFAYVTDTRPCSGGHQLATGVDLLYHEATFMDSEKNRAIETGHTTASEAATLAREAGAKRLLLSHFSARYPDSLVLENEARTIFPNSRAAIELKQYPVSAPFVDS